MGPLFENGSGQDALFYSNPHNAHKAHKAHKEITILINFCELCEHCESRNRAVSPWAAFHLRSRPGLEAGAEGRLFTLKDILPLHLF